MYGNGIGLKARCTKNIDKSGAVLLLMCHICFGKGDLIQITQPHQNVAFEIGEITPDTRVIQCKCYGFQYNIVQAAVGAAPGEGSDFQLALKRYALTNRSEEHTSELQSRPHLVCRLLLEKKKKRKKRIT